MTLNQTQLYRRQTADGKVYRSQKEWTRIRAEYESGDESQRQLAHRLSIPVNTLMQRAMREHWSQRKKLVRLKAKQIEAQLDQRADQIIKDDLAPLIEREKIRITKRGIRISNRGLTRVEKMWKTKPPTEAKFEADGARAAEMYLRMGRTSLGMNDSSTGTGTINVPILINQAAIQVSPGSVS